MMRRYLLLLFLLLLSVGYSQSKFPNDPHEAAFHTEDIDNFWRVFDKTAPKFSGDELQARYIDAGSAGLKGFIRFRIESGDKLASTLRKELAYYESIRASSLSIADRKERFYECFDKFKSIYPEAVFPDVYFVIGRKNSGGTTFSKGLIIGAEMFGDETETFLPTIDITYVDEVVTHELIHFQQNYSNDNSLLAQCIREGSADFLCELVAGSHNNGKIYAYGEQHKIELWKEFNEKKSTNQWTGWLYSSKDKSRPNDLGYWMGYKITKAYYDKASDKRLAIKEILNIRDFAAFYEKSGYSGQ